jgi:arsenate reductase (glutaredoxin)
MSTARQMWYMERRDAVEHRSASDQLCERGYMTITFYGIANCDTVKKARVWLEGRGLAYAFHDYKKQGADAARIADWIDQAGWEKVLNRAGTTFRKLPDADKQGIDAAKAVALMVANPSCIKRPVLEHPGGLLVGFKPEEWEAALA